MSRKRLRNAFPPGSVVSLYDAQMTLGANWSSARRLLGSLVAEGELRQLAEQLWVWEGADPDPYQVGARITFPYAFAGRSALALHMRDAERPTEIEIVSPEAFTPFEYAGVSYRHTGPWVAGDVALLRARRGRSGTRGVLGPGREHVRPHGGGRKLPDCVWITKIERTLSDCAKRSVAPSAVVDGLAGTIGLPEPIADIGSWDAPELDPATVGATRLQVLARSTRAGRA